MRTPPRRLSRAGQKDPENIQANTDSRERRVRCITVILVEGVSVQCETEVDRSAVSLNLPFPISSKGERLLREDEGPRHSSSQPQKM